MSKTYKDSKKVKQERKPKEGRRFESTKGRKNSNLKDMIRKGKSLEDYFV